MEEEGKRRRKGKERRQKEVGWSGRAGKRVKSRMKCERWKRRGRGGGKGKEGDRRKWDGVGDQEGQEGRGG